MGDTWRFRNTANYRCDPQTGSKRIYQNGVRSGFPYVLQQATNSALKKPSIIAESHKHISEACRAYV